MSYIVTPYEAKMIMDMSEARGGHPITKHVTMTNERLMERLAEGDGARNGGIQYISTFSSMSAASLALTEAFRNLPYGVMGSIAREKNPRKGYAYPIAVDTPFEVRFALGTGVKTYLGQRRVRLVLNYYPDLPKYGFIIKTFYPLPPPELLP